MQDAGQHFIDRIPFREIVVDVALHEDGAAVARNGRGGVQRPPGVVGESNAQLDGLLLDEAAGARGADVVHDGGRHHAVFQGGELGVLAADFDDRVCVVVEFVSGAGMCGDFVDDQIGVDDPADELAARAGGAHAVEDEFAGVFAGDGVERFEDRLQRPHRRARSLRIKTGQNAVLFVDDHRLGAG